MSAPDPCFICSSRPGIRTCDLCDSPRYCDDHEKYHRDPASGQCYPYTVSRMEGVGRVLLASRTIEPGEEIFREEEMVVGPNRKTPPVCLGCGRKVSGTVRCPGCGWPMCSVNNCPEIVQHTEQECGIIAATGERIEDNPEGNDQPSHFYKAIMTLRVLLLPDNDMSYLLEFMDHHDDRDQAEADSVVEIIRCSWGQEQFTEKMIRRVEGILDVNTVEHRVTGGPSGRSFLPITSLASHSCRSNSFKDKVSVSGWVVTRAKRRIEAGQEITFHYCAGLRGRLVRRKVLHEVNYFPSTHIIGQFGRGVFVL